MPEASASRSGASSSSDNRGASSNSDGALEPDDRSGRPQDGRPQGPLQTFNFQQATKAATSSGAPDAEALGRRAAAVHQLGAPLRPRGGRHALLRGSAHLRPAPPHRLAYSNLRHANCVLGEQGYEHPFDACVLFSDISPASPSSPTAC